MVSIWVECCTSTTELAYHQHVYLHEQEARKTKTKTKTRPLHQQLPKPTPPTLIHANKDIPHPNQNPQGRVMTEARRTHQRHFKLSVAALLQITRLLSYSQVMTEPQELGLG